MKSKIIIYLLLTIINASRVEADPISDLEKTQNECGVVCVYIIEKMWGLEPDIDRIKINSNYDPTKGSSIAGIRNAFEHDGFSCESRKYNMINVNLELLNKETPFIAHTNNHYILVIGIANGKIYYYDSPVSLTADYADFVSEWDGVMIIVRRNGRLYYDALVNQGRGINSEIASAANSVSIKPNEEDTTYSIRVLNGPNRNYGFVDRGVPIKGLFKICNKSARPINIKGITASCNCTSYSLSTKLLMPDDWAELTYKIDTSQTIGEGRVILWLSADPQSSSRALGVKYVANKAYTITPEKIIMNHIEYQEFIKTSREFIVVKTESTSVSLSRISASNPKIILNYDKSQINRIIINKFRIDVDLGNYRNMDAVDNIREFINLELSFNGKTDLVKIPIIEKVSPELAVEPETLILEKDIANPGSITESIVINNDKYKVPLSPMAKFSIESELHLVRLVGSEYLTDGTIKLNFACEMKNISKYKNSNHEKYYISTLYLGVSEKQKYVYPIKYIIKY